MRFLPYNEKLLVAKNFDRVTAENWVYWVWLSLTWDGSLAANLEMAKNWLVKVA